jgi:tRNA(Ile)-lysidine synthase
MAIVSEEQPLMERVRHYSDEHQLLQPQDTIIVGFSGGPDSLFLLLALHYLKEGYQLHLIAAHLDHGWRTNSEQDAVFCQDVADKLEIPLVRAHAADFEQQIPFQGSREEQGRLMRRCFFQACARTYHAQKIALAHHKDDQLETFFLRLIRGAGSAGLAGIWPHHGLYIRPLLCLFKDEILAYLHEYKLPYRVDISNISQRYLRNRIRAQVIPTLEATDARFKNNCLKSIEHLQETESFLEELTQKTFSNLLMKEPLTLDLNKFRGLSVFMQKRVILFWLCAAEVPFTPSSSLFNELLRFIHSPRGGIHIIGTWKMAKKKNKISINRS